MQGRIQLLRMEGFIYVHYRRPFLFAYQLHSVAKYLSHNEYTTHFFFFVYKEQLPLLPLYPALIQIVQVFEKMYVQFSISNNNIS